MFCATHNLKTTTTTNPFYSRFDETKIFGPSVCTLVLECWLGFILPAALARVLEPRVPVKDLSRSHTPDRRLDTAFHCLRQRAGRSSRTLWNNMLQLLLHGLLTVLRLSQRVWLVISTRMLQTQNHVPSMLYRRRRQEKMLRISLQGIL